MNDFLALLIAGLAAVGPIAYALASGFDPAAAQRSVVWSD